MLNYYKENRSIKKYIAFLFMVLALSTVLFITYKYHVEGEKNLPFNITKIMIISSAETEELELNDNSYQANIIQKNDVFIAIEKNDNYKKQDAIKKISLSNFNIVTEGKKGTLKIYRPSTEETDFIYKAPHEINNSVEFVGDLNTNLKMEKMTISNQGGLFQFSIVQNDLGKITYGENEDITSDGTLLKRLDLETDDISKEITFDMIIELSSGKTFKTTIALKLPTGDIANLGVCTNDDIDLDKLVFKRM